MARRKNRINKKWERVLYQNDQELMSQMECDAVNRKPTATDYMYELHRPKQTARNTRALVCTKQSTDEDCGKAAVQNVLQNTEITNIPDFADYQAIVRALGKKGKLLMTCLDVDADKRKNINAVHLSYAFDFDDDGYTAAFLLPYCRTANDKSISSVSFSTLKKWIHQYSAFIVLTHHKTATEDGHYIGIRKYNKSTWHILDSSIGEQFVVPSEAALLLLLRGAVVVIGVTVH